MTRLLFDAITPENIPTNPQMVAGYANGLYAWSQTEWNQFPGIPRASIDVVGNHYGCDVLDVESGDASVSTAVDWVKMKWRAPIIYPPVIYCNRATLTPLFNAMDAAGYKIGTHFRTWIATLDGTRNVGDMTGVTAVQYSDINNRYDASIVYDDTWMPGMPATIHGTVTWNGQERAVESSDSGKTWH